MIYSPKEYFSKDANLQADLLIVGAGTVGLYLAYLISKAEPLTKILILEAGGLIAGFPKNLSPNSSIGKYHEGYMRGRAFGVGGTSTLWAGQLAEFCQADIERSSRKWPISYDELVRLYKKTYLNLTGLNASTDKIYREQFGGDEYHSGGIERFFTHWLKTPNFSKLFKDFINSSAVDIVTHSQVNDIFFEADKAKFVAVKCENKESHNITFNKIIFTSGTLETNRFFLSTAVRGNVPWCSNELIGTYFQDHLGGTVASLRLCDKNKYRKFFENGWVGANKLQPKLKFSDSEALNFRSSVCCHFYSNSRLTESFANIKMLIRGMHSGLTFSSGVRTARDFIAISKVFFPIAWRFMVQRRIYSFIDGVKMYVQAEQIPIKESMLRIDNSFVCEDGLHPLIIDWRLDGDELLAIRSFTANVDNYLKQNKIGSLIYDLKNSDVNQIELEQLTDTYHQCGGLCMSSTPDSGVVDSDCRVWGTANVYVLGACIFPSSSHANSTFTALALATRFVEGLHDKNY